MTDLRALCARMADELDHYRQLLMDDRRATHALAAEARAALAQPEPQGPPKNCWLDDEPYLCPSPCVFDDPSEVIDNCVEARYLSEKGKPKEACKYYRTTTTIQPEPQGPTDAEPTDQEIEEWADAAAEVPLEEMDPEVHGWRRCFKSDEFSETIRAALARWGRPAIEPVPVSERLPGPEDCDAEGRCWFYTPSSYVMNANWVYRKAEHRRSWDTHWAPHWALPVPAPANTINQNNY